MKDLLSLAYILIFIFLLSTCSEDTTDNEPETGPKPTGRISFDSDRDGDKEIFIVDAAGGQPVQLTNNDVYDVVPDISLDGSKIVYETWDGNDSEIWSMNSDGSNKVQLTNNTDRDLQARWSGTATKILFTTRRDGNGEIYIMNTDGSYPTNITNHNSDDYNIHKDNDYGKPQNFEI